MLYKNYSLSSATLSSKNSRRYSKKCARTSTSALIRLYDYDENEAENEK